MMVKASNVRLNGISLEETETWVKLGKDTSHTYKETIGTNQTIVTQGSLEETVVRFKVRAGDEAGQLKALYRIKADLDCTMEINNEQVRLVDGAFVDQRSEDGGASYIGHFMQEDEDPT